MAAGRFENQRLLLLGVGDSPASRRLFDVGGVGEGESVRTFDIEQPPVVGESIRVFDILGRTAGESVRVFDVLGLLSGDSTRVFDIVSDSPDGTRPGLPVPVTSGVAQTIGGGGAALGATTVTVTGGTTGMGPGTLLNIDGEYRVVTAATSTTVSFSVPLGVAHAAGAPITTANIVTVRLAADALAGDTVIYVHDTWAIVDGTITLGGSDYVIAAVDEGTDRIFLTSALGASSAAGSIVQHHVAFLPAISVYDKAGWLLGLITRWSASAVPSRMIGRTGSFEFYLPRRMDWQGTPETPTPDIAMVQGDRLVRVGTSEDTEPWGGTMIVDQSVNGRIQVTCPDLFDLLRGESIKIDEEPESAVGASALYAKALSLLNAIRAGEGEVQWTLDAAGSHPLYGDLHLDTEPLDAISDIATRSNTEFAWRADEVIDGGRVRLQPVLVVRDLFDAGTGVAFTDGENGNIAAQPVFVENTAARINAIRLRGPTTNVQKYLPEWARWAVYEFEPFVEVSQPTGDYRRRKDLSVTVQWGLSKSTLRTLARRTEARLRAMYSTFIYAYHDQEGRPYHEGWRYLGPPPDLERHLHTGNGWRTRRALIQYKGDPASSSMIGPPISQILVTTYNRITGVQDTRRVFFSEADGQLYLLRMSVHGWVKTYSVRGGVIVGGGKYHAFDHSRATVSANQVRLMWPGEGPGSDHPTTTYHTLRKVIGLTEEGTETEGVWFDTNDVRGPTTGPTFTRPTIGDPPYIIFTPFEAPNKVELNADFITKIWDFEQLRIRDWDPRRDGVGALLNKRTIVRNQPTTSERWHIVPWHVADDATTSLSTGINATQTEIAVESIFSLPTADKLPFILTIGDSPANEDVEVTQIRGTLLTVKRGRNGTTAIVHEVGEPVRYALPEGEERWDGFVVHQKVVAADGTERLMLDGQPLWPEGEAWAAELLTRINLAAKRISFPVINRDSAWSTIRLGSRHTITITSEGRPGGITGTVRVIGYSPDAVAGVMQVVLEWV